MLSAFLSGRAILLDQVRGGKLRLLFQAMEFNQKGLVSLGFETENLACVVALAR